jgi:NTP pyrophosphatase (non-canonical NTP hydrolase)
VSAPAEQRLVRETMLAAGGYWRPLAAVARLLEELGELSELLFSGAEEPEGLGAELADLWIITTALADQFLAEVEEPGHGSEAMVDLGTLVAAAGPIARVVNHYDGPKVPRPGEPMPTLQGAITGFHMALAAFAATHRVDLAAAVREKIEHIHARGDIERFGRAGFDPSTARVLRAPRPSEVPQRLWGAPEPEEHPATAVRRAALAREPLSTFAKAAAAERLEGFVIAGPQLDAAAGRAAWLGALVAALDPDGAPQAFQLAGVALRARAIGTADATLALVEPR